ncbi:MAG: hypothetical protein LH629_08920 [Ignavibacteria bacterium]|nr:hypothetical protein [Ignavibacteria bacterium]
MKNILYAAIFTVFISGCSKMEEKKPNVESKSPVKENSKMAGTENKPQNSGSDEQLKDEKAETLVKSADDAVAKYTSDNSDGNKKNVVSSCMAAANYLMFEAGLPPKEKYRPALKYYREVLKADPENEEALKNKKQIEDIYESMGMPIPK